jgi:hypothetical protein
MNGPVTTMRRSWRLSGLSGGSHTYKFAWSRATSGTFSMFTGPTYGFVEMTVWEGI